VGRPATRLQASRHARPGPGCGRRRAGILGRAARGVSRDQGAALLVPQDRQRALGHAQIGPPGAKKALAEIWNAEGRDHARRAAAAFKLAYGAKFGKAVAKITDDLDELLRFYDYPAEHWIHLRTTNPIESTFATVRNRSKITKGPGSKAAGLAMAFKLIEAAQARWRAINAPHVVALVRAGAAFKNGKLVERPGRATRAQDEAA
jgi:Transposase, Mutator family